MQFLAMKNNQEPVFINRVLNSIVVVVHPKSISSRSFKIIKAMLELIMQNDQPMYQEIATTLGNGGISIHSISHWTFETICLCCISQNFSIVQKGCVD